MSFGRDEFGICFLLRSHNYHFFVGVRFYIVCVVADIAVVLSKVSGFLLEVADVFFYVVDVLVLTFVFLFVFFGAILNAAGFVVVDDNDDISVDGEGVLLDGFRQLLKVFAAVFSPLSPHIKQLILLSLTHKRWSLVSTLKVFKTGS